MKKLMMTLLLLLPLLTGCMGGLAENDALADRVYARALSLHSTADGLTLSLQSFDETSCTTVHAGSIPEALALEEAQAGGRVFTGHTELVCIDDTITLEQLTELFFEEGLSPSCKVVYAPYTFLDGQDSTVLVQQLRMRERRGLLPETDLTSVLEDWLGDSHTALLPTPDGETVLLIRNS